MVEFHRIKLKNGLIVLFEKRKLPVVCTSVSIKFGAEYESKEQKGISHFIEHLVFKGTKKRSSKDISEEIEKKGGILNAFTSEEITCYWNKVPSKYFEIGIDITSDVTLNPLFKSQDLEKERKVILEEIRMYHDSPHIYVLQKIKSLLYGPPFGLPISGTFETMTSLSKIDILNIFRSVYSTNNMILTVVGNAEFSDICSLGETIFPKTKNPVEVKIPSQKNSELLEKRRGIEQAHFVLGFHTPSLYEKNRFAAEIFDIILTGGMSSRLFQEIREKKGLAYSVEGILEQEKNYGYELIYVGTDKGNIKKVKSLILKEIKKMRNLKNKDHEEAQDQLIGLRNVQNESSEKAMINLITEENAGNAENLYRYEENINSVDLECVQKLARLKSYSLMVLVPN